MSHIIKILKKNHKKLLVFILLTIIISLFLFSKSEFINNKIFEIMNYLKHLFETNPTKTIIFFILIYIFCVTLSLPFASTLSITGGIIFNWTAFYLIVFSATFGATLLFLLAKYVFSNFFFSLTNNHYIKFKNFFLKNSFSYLITLRIIPLFPFWVVNILPAFLKINLFTYITTTFIGIIPGTLIYVWIGINLNYKFLSNDIFNDTYKANQNLFLSLFILGLLFLAKPIYNNLKKK